MKRTRTRILGMTVETEPTLSPTFLGLSGVLFFILFSILFLPSVVEWSLDFKSPEVGQSPFTITVDPVNKTIREDPNVEAALANQNSSLGATALLAGSLEAIAVSVAQTVAYQQLASPVAPHIVVIPAGARKEQVASAIGKELAWTRAMREKFLKTAQETLLLSEGAFSPGTYVFVDKATPEQVVEVMRTRFDNRILSRYATTTMEIVPLKDAFIIASMIERESNNDVEEMRTISGIMWNRLFIGMRLQIDATLQYARGTASNGWWPVVRSRDKYINSPFNTYRNVGLPPAPISNPSIAAVIAALNPIKTSCLFYFHDAEGEFYCSDTYEQHVSKLREIYGRGR